MVQINVAYEGQLRCAATHAPSGTKLQTDAPRDNQGRGESFSPTDLLATGLGTCMLTIMGIAANKQQINLQGTTVSIVKEMVADPMRRVGKLTVEFKIPIQVTPEQQQLLENAAHTCPVRLSLLPAIEIPVTFEWGSSNLKSQI